MSKKNVKNKNKRWTEAEDEQLLSLWATEGAKSIAERLGRTKASVSQRRNTLLRRRREMTVEERPDHDLSEPQQRQQPPHPIVLMQQAKMLIDAHNHMEAKLREQRLVIEDTIEKLDVLLGRLRKVLE
jgi:hypothetical protein